MGDYSAVWGQLMGALSRAAVALPDIESEDLPELRDALNELTVAIDVEEQNRV